MIGNPGSNSVEGEIMYPQYQGQAFAPQGIWGGAQFAQTGPNLNDVVNVISRILPLLQLQASQFTPQQTGGFGFPQQQFAPQGLIGSQIGHPGAISPFQTGAFGYPQSVSQPPNLLEVVNVLSRILPVLQQTALQQPHLWGQQQGSMAGFPQQQFAGQGINPETVSVISRILPFLGTQMTPFAQTGAQGSGFSGSPYTH
jgi:hypothetical protein